MQRCQRPAVATMHTRAFPRRHAPSREATQWLEWMLPHGAVGLDGPSTYGNSSCKKALQLVRRGSMPCSIHSWNPQHHCIHLHWVIRDHLSCVCLFQANQQRETPNALAPRSGTATHTSLALLLGSLSTPSQAALYDPTYTPHLSLPPRPGNPQLSSNRAAPP